MPVTIVGNNTPTAGGVVYGDGTNYASTAAGTSGQVLTSNGASAPTWNAPAAVNLATGVTGTLPVANGGTGSTTLTANNVLLGNGTSALQVVAPGTNGNVLTSNGTTWTSSAPATGAMTLISSQSFTASPTTAVTFDNISATYSKYVLILEGVYSGTATVTAIGMQYRCSGTTDTSAVYGNSNTVFNGAVTPAGSSVSGQSAHTLLNANAAYGDSVANAYSGVINIFTRLNTSAASYNVLVTGLSGAAFRPQLIGGRYTGSGGLNSAVTGIYIYPFAGTSIYGQFSLYGIS